MPSVAPSRHLPLLSGRDFPTPARAVVDMGEKTPRTGNGVEKLVLSRTGHVALPFTPQCWHRNVHVWHPDVPARIREESRKRRNPRG